MAGLKMNHDDFDAMETKYGAAFVQDIRDRLAACQVKEVQYLEMKQMLEILFRFRERARAMISHYRVWKHSYEAEKDDIERVYKAYEGLFIRQQLRDSWKLYLTVNRDYHEMYKTYMDQIETKKKTPFSYERHNYRSAA
jgi:hypothetical protein